MSKFTPSPVPCPNCGETFLETTESFDPTKMTNGTMLRLTEKYGPDGLNWSCFPQDEWILGDALECPGCGAPMGGMEGMVVATPSNIEWEDDKNGKAKGQETGEETEKGQEVTAHVCTECGKVCSTAHNLERHTAAKHAKR